MIPLPLSDVASVIGARATGVDASEVVTAVEVDSRLAKPGALFVALPGERTDGHDHAAAAVSRGAVAAVTSRPLPGVPCLVVPEPLAALQELARAVFVIDVPPLTYGVTGSSGKTSTKDLLAHVLTAWAPTLWPTGSFNNEVGFPLTVLRREVDTRGAVLEYSSRGPGHIAFLCGIAAPHVAVVLNVGSAHLGEFGTREAIALAKGELVEGAQSMAVLNADDPLVMGMAGRLVDGGELHTFGLGEDAEYRAEGVELDAQGRASFVLHRPARGERAEVSLGLHGAHHVSNALAVAAGVMAMGLLPGGLAQVAGLLGGAVPQSRWRMEVTERADGVTVVNDAYNANPESMRAAVDALAAMGRRGRRTVAVLGEMAELGPGAEEEHRAVGAHLARSGISRLVVVGPGAAGIAAGAPHVPADVVEDADAAVRLLHAALRPGDVVLVKASRSARLERVAAALLAGRP